VAKIQKINQELQKDSSQEILAASLDEIKNIFDQSKTFSTIKKNNPTVTCDDAAATIKLINERIDFYHRIGVDTRKQISVFLNKLGNLKIFFAENSKSLKTEQKQSINDLINSLNGFADELRNYFTDISRAVVNFAQVLDEAETARKANCICSPKSNTQISTNTSQSKLKFILKVREQT
jgi:hypothetical protein